VPIEAHNDHRAEPVDSTARSRCRDALPRLGTARRERDGQPADLLDPHAYPLAAVCSRCDRPIRIRAMYLADWQHTASTDEPAGC
jgi:hypothetical protein